MGRDDRGQTVGGVHLAQQRVQRVGGLLVEIAGRFVGEEDRRLHDERARHRDALLLAARQHAGPVRETLAQADPPQQRLGARPRLGDRSRAIRIGISAFSSALNSGNR